MKYRHYDRWLLFVTVLLIIFGAVMIYSSTSVVTPLFAKRNITPFYYFRRHIFTVLIGAAFMYILSKTSTETLRRAAIPFLIVSFILAVLVFVPGVGVSAGGAKRWIRLWPSTFQPSEMVKFAMVIFLASYMASPKYRPESLVSFMIPVGIMGIFQIIFLRQPDFGATMSLGIITIMMLLLSGVRLRYAMFLMVLAIPVAVKLVMEPYRMKRILAFLDPWKDPQGSGFQLVQSFIALGSGGIAGVGLGESKQKLSFLPESHTDFIFSLIGEELGFAGAAVIVCLFFFLFFRGISIAHHTKTPFCFYLASGLTMMISLQALINFAVTTGLVPTKGLPLPFISYGGSSMLMNMAAIGILLRISKGDDERKRVDKTEGLIARKKALMSVYGRGSTPQQIRLFEGEGNA